MIAWLFEVHRDATGNIIDLPQGTDQQGGRNADGLFLSVGVHKAEFVVQAVFSADERSLQGDGDVVAGQGGANERAERFGAIGIAPAEVIQDRDPTRIRSDGHRVPHRFVDRRGGHVIRIEVAVARVHAAADDQSTARIEDGSQDGGIAGSVVLGTDQRFDDTPALHFVIVLANDPFFAGDVQAAEDLEQIGREVVACVEGAGVSLLTVGADRRLAERREADRRAGIPSTRSPTT